MLRVKRTILVLIVLLASFFVRGFAFFQYSYPTGADYGHHTYFADQYLDEGRFPARFPFYQLGRPRWSNLPGGALTYSLVSAVSGATAFELASLTSIFAIIEVAGVYLLGLRVFRRFDAAFVAALVAGLVPSAATMVAWSAYANIIALAFMPYAFLALLDYWESPTASRLALAAVTLCGAASIHHLSTMWMGLTLVLFSFVLTIVRPLEALRRLLPLAIVGVVVGLPILVRIEELHDLFASAQLETAADRFVEARVRWSNWAQLASAASLMFLSGGIVSLLRRREVKLPHRVLVASYLLVSLVLAFGWWFGLEWYYIRALYFLSIPIALGAASLLFLWPRSLLQLLVAACLAVSLGVGTFFQAESTARYYEVLSPGVMEGVEWLRDFSGPNDVVVAGAFLGFHLPRLLERPIIVGLPPDLVGNPDDTLPAKDAFRILTGEEGMEEALVRQNVKFVILRVRGEDLPDPSRSRAVIAAHRHFLLMFQNEDIVIFGARPR